MASKFNGGMEIDMKKESAFYIRRHHRHVPTELGYAPKKKYFSSLLDEISQLKNKDMPNWDVVEFDPLLDSANVAVEQWVNIGREIRDRYHMYDGFVVLHGTDTMAYTASALSFMLGGS